MNNQEVKNEVALADELAGTLQALRAEIGKAIIGQQEVVDQMLIAILCRGHALLVGVPGLAKTLLVSTVSQTMSLSFSRIQFTPDLMPGDILGSEVLEVNQASGEKHFRFIRGPIFANIVLADEINRTPPKTQAALLEAMQERRVTVAGTTMALGNPFFVLATQNPIEQEGTYPLPEAQLDRFMFNLKVDYPSPAEELEIVKATTSDRAVELNSILIRTWCARCQWLKTWWNMPCSWWVKPALPPHRRRAGCAIYSAGGQARGLASSWYWGPRRMRLCGASIRPI
jgi:MoxR-like ATPase